MSQQLALVAPATLTIDVEGVPAPQGSKSYKGMRNGKPILAESSKKVAPWRTAVEKAARARMTVTGCDRFDGPVELSVKFFLPRGKTVTRERPTGYPDLSKLIRSTEDALTSAGVWRDDAQVVRYGDVEKHYTTTGLCGARIVVTGI